jgi:hypothetical protein
MYPKGMLDDLLENIDLSGRASGRPSAAAGAVRRVFGLLGLALSLVGAVRCFSYAAGVHFRLAGALLFVAVACFCLFNVALARQWLWPILLVPLSLAALFAVRIMLGP